MMIQLVCILSLLFVYYLFSAESNKKDIRDLGANPENCASENKIDLQKAIDWASVRGTALFVEPSDKQNLVDGGILLKMNVPLVMIIDQLTEIQYTQVKNCKLEVILKSLTKKCF